MARKKKEIHKVEMTDGKRAIIQQLFQEYNIESATDIQDALKDGSVRYNCSVIDLHDRSVVSSING